MQTITRQAALAFVVQQIRRLIAAGVKPADVTVIGTSKGSMIAMLVSTRLTDPVRYVLGELQRFHFRGVLVGTAWARVVHLRRE